MAHVTAAVWPWYTFTLCIDDLNYVLLPPSSIGGYFTSILRVFQILANRPRKILVCAVPAVPWAGISRAQVLVYTVVN